MDAKQSEKFQWPWESGELVKSKSLDEDKEDNRPSVDLNDSLDARYSLKSPRKSPKNMKLSSQKFAYNKNTGFIYCIDQPSLVLAVGEVVNNTSEVFLQKKSDDNINQRWIYRSDDGLILSKARLNFALTIKMPPLIETAETTTTQLNGDAGDSLEEKTAPSILTNSLITIQPLVDFEHGNAHQKWLLDEFGFVYAFQTSQLNIEITAAHRAGICTYYVAQDDEISQPVCLRGSQIQITSKANLIFSNNKKRAMNVKF
jgi:hypothetical protein